jgi:hypothetical protein
MLDLLLISLEFGVAGAIGKTSAPVFTATIQWAPSLDSLGELFFFLFKLASYLNFLYQKEATSSTFKRPAMLPALV